MENVSASREMLPIFMVSISSVATAATLASAGFYLHRRGYLTSEGKSALARFSQQVALPCLFFSNLVSCPADRSSQVCPSIWDQVPHKTAFLLLIWPLVVVSCGIIIGTVCVRYLSRTPPWQQRSMVVAVAFANSTGMPTTLLSVLHSHAPMLWSAHAELNPTALLSLYVVFYQTLLWGVGGWLLKAPKSKGSPTPQHNTSPSATIEDDEERPLVLSTELAKRHCSKDATSTQLECKCLEHDGGANQSFAKGVCTVAEEGHTAVSTGGADCGGARGAPTAHAVPCDESLSSTLTIASLCRWISGNLVPQPPVLGALLGLLFSSSPWLRQLWVGTYDGGQLSAVPSSAPLGWLLAAITSLGKAAIPLNMAVLGINLSKTAMGENHEREQRAKPVQDGLSCSTIFMVVVGKLVLLPMVGLAIVRLIQRVQLDDNNSEELSNFPPPVILVMLVVFLTPTANTVMLMVDLADGMKAEMALILAFQYLSAPFLLSATIALAVRQAQGN